MAEKIRNLLILHEAKRNEIYEDSEGLATIGIGHCLDRKAISDAAVYQIFEDDLDDVMRQVSTLSFWDDLNEVRQAVLIDMCFNLGFRGLKNFKKMMSALKVGDYVEAAAQMIDSKWSRQVKTRAARLEKMMISGNWPDDID